MKFPTDPQPRWIMEPSEPGKEIFRADSAVDWLGNRFHVGWTVMYCAPDTAGNGHTVALGKVVAIQYWHAVKMTAIGVTEVEDEPTVRVQVCTMRTPRDPRIGRKRSFLGWIKAISITAVCPELVSKANMSVEYAETNSIDGVRSLANRL